MGELTGDSKLSVPFSREGGRDDIILSDSASTLTSNNHTKKHTYLPQLPTNLSQSLPINSDCDTNVVVGDTEQLLKRRVPKGRSNKNLLNNNNKTTSSSSSKASQLFASFTKKKSNTRRSSKNQLNNHSAHPMTLNKLVEDDDKEHGMIRRNSHHDMTFSLNIEGDSAHSSVDRMLVNRDSNGSIAMSLGAESSGGGAGFGSRSNSILTLDSKSILEGLGDSPSQHELANIAAIRANEYIDELLTTDVSVIDRKKWENIPKYTKMDLVVGKFLGKGSFSDVFEVFATIAVSNAPTIASLGSDRADLDKLLEERFGLDGSGRSGNGNGDDDGDKIVSIEKIVDTIFSSNKNDDEDENDLDNQIDAMFAVPKPSPSPVIFEEEEEEEEEEGEELDAEIDTLFGESAPKKSTQRRGSGLRSSLTSSISNSLKLSTNSLKSLMSSTSNEDGDDGGGEKSAPETSKSNVQKIIESRRASGAVTRANSLRTSLKKPKAKSIITITDIPDKEIEAKFGAAHFKSLSSPELEFQPQKLRRNNTSMRRCGAPRRRLTEDLGASVCMGTQARSSTDRRRERKVMLAMKCLRPQIRSDAEQFMIGVDDLVHETAMLAMLDHPHIVKIHGRAGGSLSNSFRLSDGFFILLDRLTDTLDDRIPRWKKITTDKKAPTMSQIKTAISIADALSYLHTNKIIFRDLKPANVGYDNTGVLKLFDFGFATVVEEVEHEGHLLYDKCGTPRYMAPEVGLEHGYHLPADVYSFGILLWEICALKKPFGNVKSAIEFEKAVFEKGSRPKVSNHWPRVLQELTTNCWSSDPEERPSMAHVKTMLVAYAREEQNSNSGKRDTNNILRNSVLRRFTG